MLRLTKKLSENVNRVAQWLPSGTKLYPQNASISCKWGTNCNPNTCIANWGQTASASSTVTIGTSNTLSNSTITNPYRDMFSQNKGVRTQPQNLHGTLWPNCIGKMVAIDRLQTSARCQCLFSHQTAIVPYKLPVSTIGHPSDSWAPCFTTSN